MGFLLTEKSFAKEIPTASLASHKIVWPELRFPPINLWVVASLSSGRSPKGSLLGTHMHRRQRPGVSVKRPNALRKLHRRLESLLAVRGGK